VDFSLGAADQNNKAKTFLSLFILALIGETLHDVTQTEKHAALQ